jgi:hypothetical protein
VKQIVLALLMLVPAAAQAQPQEIERSLVQRDQMTAEFAAQLRGSQDVRQLEVLHAQQLREALVPLSADPAIAQQLLPYQRGQMAQQRAQEYELRFAPPAARKSVSGTDLREPLALPGGPRAGVDSVAPDRLSR